MTKLTAASSSCARSQQAKGKSRYKGRSVALSVRKQPHGHFMAERLFPLSFCFLQIRVTYSTTRPTNSAVLSFSYTSVEYSSLHVIMSNRLRQNSTDTKAV